jgi:apolipoprotein D and lipocalin family protein
MEAARRTFAAWLHCNQGELGQRKQKAMRTKFRCAAAVAMLLAAVSASSQDRSTDDPGRGQQPVVAIESLDLPRYMGQWFEIAKFPNRFQAKCAGDTSAHYELQPDATVKVVNRCRLEDGRMDEALGVARQVGTDSSPKLQVRFAPRWLSFLPFVWGDYWVIDLDPDYRLAAVGDPGREYLWILSRTPTVSAAAYGALTQRLRHQGFDVDRLQRSVHGAP